MAKLFSTRKLFLRYPWLDKLRTDVLGSLFVGGIAWFDRSFARVQIVCPEARPYVRGENAYILAIYHNCMISVLGVQPRDRMTVLISDSRDGEMVARGLMGMGFPVARGSPTHGAVKGAMQMVEALKDGKNVCFMVDGPRGPIYQVKMSIIRLAEVTGLPIIPLGFRAPKAFQTRSWDDWRGTTWGGSELYVFDKPIFVPQGASAAQLEECRLQLQERMDYLRKAVVPFWPIMKHETDGKELLPGKETLLEKNDKVRSA